LGNSGELIPVERREKILTAEDAEGAEIKKEGADRDRTTDRPGMDRGGGRHDDVACSRMSDGRSSSLLIFLAFFSAFSG
jgi:hypothetical protein